MSCLQMLLIWSDRFWHWEVRDQSCAKHNWLCFFLTGGAYAYDIQTCWLQYLTSLLRAEWQPGQENQEAFGTGVSLGRWQLYRCHVLCCHVCRLLAGGRENSRREAGLVSVRSYDGGWKQERPSTQRVSAAAPETIDIITAEYTAAVNSVAARCITAYCWFVTFIIPTFIIHMVRKSTICTIYFVTTVVYLSDEGWRGYLSGMRCKWLAYGSADAVATPSCLASIYSRMVYPSATSLPRFSRKKRPLNECVCIVYLNRCEHWYICCFFNENWIFHIFYL